MVIALDFDGVLVDTRDANIDAINSFAAQYDFPVLSRADYTRMLEYNFTEFWQMLLGARAKAFFADLHTVPRPRVALVPGMRDVLIHTRPAIVSSNHSSLIHAVLRDSGVDAPVYGIDYDPSKIRKLTRLRKHPDIFVTDTVGDVDEGKLAGYLVIGVAWGFMPAEELHKRGAHKIARTPEELGSLIAQLR